MSDARLRAFCGALHVNQIEKLMTGSVGDFRALGARMHERTGALKAESNEAHQRIAELERKLGEARALGRWEPLLEALWVATKGVHPETGEAWLTPRMEREADHIRKEANE